MIRLFIMLVLLSWIPLGEAAERLSARLSQRLYVIMERAAEDPDTALEDLRLLLQSRSMSPTEKGTIAYERAGLLVQQGRSETALTELGQLLDDESIVFIPRLRRLYAQLLLMNNDPTQALEQMELWASEVEDPQPVELVLMGYTYLQLERFDNAARVLEQSISLAESPQPQWSELLAFAYTQSGRTDLAISLLESLIAAQPDQARWWRQLASVYLLIEDTSRGTAGLVVASHIQQFSYDEARRLAGLFTTLGMPADGAILLSRAMAMQREPSADPVGFEDQMLLGEMWMLARELDRAVEAFSVAAQTRADSEPYLKTAQLYLQRERYDEAREALLKAATLAAESESGQISYLLAVTEINLGNLRAASNLLLRLRDDPDFADRADRLDNYLRNRLDSAIDQQRNSESLTEPDAPR